MLGYAGFDFVLIDTEQAPCGCYGMELENLIRAALAADLAPLVRVTEVNQSMIEKALNFGAKGVVIPHVNTKEEMSLCVQAAKYPPEGSRGSAPPLQAAKYGFHEWGHFWKQANRETVVIPLIEEKVAVDNLEEILTVKGIDAVFFGPFDLSMTLGLGGVIEHPLIDEYSDRVYSLCKQKGVPIMEEEPDYRRAKKILAKGCTNLLLGTDLVWFADKFSELMRFARREIRGNMR